MDLGGAYYTFKGNVTILSLTEIDNPWVWYQMQWRVLQIWFEDVKGNDWMATLDQSRPCKSWLQLLSDQEWFV